MRVPRRHPLRHGLRHGLLSATAGSLLLGSLTTAPAAAAPGAPLAPTSPAESRGVVLSAERAAARGLKFAACPKAEQLPASVRCASVEVPLDYAHPDGERIALTVSRAPATGRPAEKGGAKPKRQGALVFNPGGPGASGTYFPMIGVLPEWKRLAAAYDFVGYAPRGVARSAPLSCVDPKEFGQAPSDSPVHPDAAYKRERVARAKAYAKGCARRSGPGLRHYTSLNNARDLEVLRAALHEDGLTFMGASYGTYYGALYATLFPGHVRRMVFDSAVDPAPRQVWYRDNLDQSYAFETRWHDFRVWVARHDAAYHLGNTSAKVGRAYDKVRARLAKKPAGGKVGPAQLQGAFLQAAYYDDYWRSRAEVLSRFVKGDEKPLVRLASPAPDAAKENENGNAVYTAVECNDAPWPTDFRTWDRDNSDLATVAPFETWDNAWMNLPCAYWPTPPRLPLDVGVRPGALAPTLILAAQRDAATPYPGALELRRRLSGAALVTERDAGTHGIAGGPNDCVNEAVNAYLLEGRVPEGGESTCAPHAAPTPAKPARKGGPQQGDGARDTARRRIEEQVRERHLPPLPRGM